MEGEAGQAQEGQPFYAAVCWRFSQEKVIGLACQHHVNNVFDQRSLSTFLVGWGGLALISAALANLDRRGPLKYCGARGPSVLTDLGDPPVVRVSRPQESGVSRIISLGVGEADSTLTR